MTDPKSYLSGWSANQLARAIAATTKIPFCPWQPSEKGRAFLALAELGVKEAMFGGAAGGGKSVTGLMGACLYTEYPDFRALILRRSYADLSKPGALMDIASQWFGGTSAKWDTQEKKWIFPSGAEICFGYLEGQEDHIRYQGAAYHYIFFDELTQFKEKQYKYLFSRQRRTRDSKIPILMRSASNPGGPGHQWVFKRFVNQKNTPERVFIQSLLADNPHLDQAEYRKSLAELDEVERRQLEHGDWFARQTGLVYPSFESCVTKVPQGVQGRKVGGIDWGWHNPFAALAGTLDHDDVLWLDYERHGSYITLSDHSASIPRGVEWLSDPAGADQCAELRIAGHNVTPSTHRGKDPMESGIAAVTARMRTGRLKIAERLLETRKEAGIYRRDDATGKPIDKDNHCLAALRYLVMGLDRGHVVVNRETSYQRSERLRVEEEAENAIRDQIAKEWRRIDNPAFWQQSE